MILAFSLCVISSTEAKRVCDIFNVMLFFFLPAGDITKNGRKAFQYAWECLL